VNSFESPFHRSLQIGSMAQKRKFEGPVIGAKMADENRRDFSQATLQAGKNIISLQVSSIRSNYNERWTSSNKTFNQSLLIKSSLLARLWSLI